MPPTDPHHPVLEAYGLRPKRITAAGGTAGRTWRVETAEERYFVRRRGARTSTAERIRFDHGLRRHLVDHGFATAAPLPAADGATVVWYESAAYEAYPWIDGHGLRPELAAAARVPVAEALARIHTIAASYDGVCEATVPQFGHYPSPIAEDARFDAPPAFVAALDQLRRFTVDEAQRGALVRARERVAWLYEQYSASRWGRLPRAVIHGDYNACNLLFRDDGGVAGVFDYDWAWRDVRVRDVGEALFFFGAVRDDEPDGGSIWSLTACPRFDGQGMRDFLAAYHRAAPLTAEELQAVPLAMLGRWVACRTEGAMKVPDDQKVAFAMADFEQPFAWYTAHAAALLESVA